MISGLLLHDHLHMQAGIQPQDLHAPVEQHILFPSLVGKALKAHKLRLEKISAALLHDFGIQLNEMVPCLGHQIDEQVLFIPEILVKAPPGYPCPAHDLVGGRLGKADAGKLLPGRLQKPGAFFLRQMEECLGAHIVPPSDMTICRIMTRCRLL